MINAFLLTLALASGADTYQAYCSVCHGITGRGDGVGAAGLDPKPADFTDPVRAKNTTRATQIKVVTEGGAAANMSPAMPPFGSVLSEQQISEVVDYVRSLVKKVTNENK